MLLFCNVSSEHTLYKNTSSVLRGSPRKKPDTTRYQSCEGSLKIKPKAGALQPVRMRTGGGLFFLVTLSFGGKYKAGAAIWPHPLCIYPQKKGYGGIVGMRWALGEVTSLTKEEMSSHPRAFSIGTPLFGWFGCLFHPGCGCSKNRSLGFALQFRGHRCPGGCPGAWLGRRC